MRQPIRKKRHSIGREIGTALGLAGLMAALLLVAASVSLAAPRYGGTLNLGHENDASGFDAIKGRYLLSAGHVTAVLVMERLFEMDTGGRLIPELGLDAAVSADGKTWTVNLRRGVRFHDGTPFGADAVVTHWQRILDPKNRFRGRLLLTPIASVQKAGPYAVQFLLKHPWPAFASTLTNSGSFAAFIPSPKAVAEESQNRHPVGTGPFVFQEWRSGDRIVLKKNPDYREKGKPYLDAVVIRVIPDHESRYAALVSGQVDAIITDRPVHVEKLRANGNFAEHVLDLHGAGILVLNTTKPPLDDVRVRRALAHAWNQKQYIRASYKDMMPFREHWFGDALHCRDTGYRHPDLARARALMAEYGRPVELEYIHSATPRGREAGVILQQMMKSIGVKITPVARDFSGIAKALFSRQFDITSWVIPGSRDMGPITVAQLHSKSPWNVSRYADEEMDALLNAQKSTIDPAARAEIFCQIVRKVNEDVPFLLIFGRRYYGFVNKRIQGVIPPIPGLRGMRLEDSWIGRNHESE